MILLALLPVAPKSKNDSSADSISAENRVTIHRILENIFESLRDPGQMGVIMDCADGKKRLCFPVLCGWIADHMEHTVLHNIKITSCPKCEVEFEELEESPASSPEKPIRDHSEYQQLVEEHEQTGSMKPIEELARRGLKALSNAFWTLPRINTSDIHKPDILHTVYLGILKHMMEWIQSFLSKHKLLESFDDIWKSLGPYPGLTIPTKAYREITQWQGKEMRNLGRVITGVFAAALRNPSNDTQRKDFKAAISCVTALIDFHLIIQYRTHTESTLNDMEKYLESFHEHKEIFREFRPGMKGKKNTKSHNAEGTAKRRKITDGKAKRVAMEEQKATNGPHFNFIKMHLLRHFRSHVESYGNIPLFSTDVSELAHKVQIKDSYRRSNKNNATVQILDNYTRLHTFGMRLLNVRAVLSETPETLARAQTIPDLNFFLKTDSRAVSGQIKAYSRPKCRLRGVDSKVRSLREVAQTMELPELVQSIAAYARSNDDKDLLQSSQNLLEFWRFPAERFNMLQVPVSVFQESDTYDIHNIRSTGPNKFRGGEPRNDSVWVYVGNKGRGDLGEYSPGFLKCLLKLRDVTTGRTYRFAVVESLAPMNGGAANSGGTFIRVQRKVYKTPGKAYSVVNIRSIVGIAHLIKYGEGQWLVNNRIDLRTWNTIFMKKIDS
jgi:Plavaka transposase